ncbi:MULTISPECIES: non-ribosomal peptide synthetase [Pseudoalteromonas]|uniref:Carrier domain-containing protein n=1 Tax=Pseudoalteromonas amylolytica TaxID=1859457 RepID=A0A1S1MUG4_9GAMM|nr:MULTISPECIES: non-ribosomal peptide synthetase [Pseudoalteromonas]OHU90238.1 hypothetical protein BFC16_04635 [Pseudoalteromonas sp. JW3]OHU92395.1 hypothetical protein BET10_05585 [Pseudoalteromonas amylolytica]
MDSDLLKSAFKSVKFKQENSNEIKILNKTQGPQSHAQERLWLHYLLEPTANAYNLNLSYRITGEVDFDLFKQAAEKLVARNQELRTNFAQVDGENIQIINDEVVLPVSFYDLSNPEFSSDLDKAIAKIEQEQILPAFNMTDDCLVRFSLARLGDNDYIMTIVVHHILCDGWAAFLLADEFQKIYRCLADGHELPAKQPKVSYLDYSIWERSQQRQAYYDEAIAYWRDVLHDLPKLNLFQTQKDSKQPKQGKLCKVNLNPEQLKQIKDFCNHSRLTLNMYLLACYQLVLGRFSGQNDIAVGVSVANRDNKQLHDLVGFFTNLLVIRNQWDDTTNNIQLLESVKSNMLDAMKYQDVSYHHVKKAVSNSGARESAELFQANFFMTEQLKEIGDGESGFAGMTSQRLMLNETANLYDLTLSAEVSERGLDSSFFFDETKFDPFIIEQLAAAFNDALLNLCAHPQARVHDYELVDRQQQFLNSVYQGTTRDINKHGDNLFDCFYRQAQLHPDRECLVYKENKLTYQQVLTRANRLSHYLLEVGVEPKTKVGISLTSKMEVAISTLAILQIGAVYVPLDPAGSSEYFDQTIKVAALQALISEEDVLDNLPSFLLNFVEVIAVDEEEEDIAQCSDNCVEGGYIANNSDLAYVMFTSGSTGKPKGVQITHGNILRTLSDPNYLPINAEDRVMHAAPITFDGCTLETWAAFLNGAALVVVNDNRIDLEQIEDCLVNQRITLAWLTSVMFNTFVDYRIDALRGLKQLMIGGEVVSPKHIKKAMEQLSELAIYNGYGPTECTVFSSMQLIQQRDLSRISIPIGKPVDNTRLYILGRNEELLPPGAIGELVIAGDGVGVGYIGVDDVIKHKFKPWSHGQLSEDRVYFTGDLVAWNQFGELEFVGRTDEQVKLNGHRIELTAIESAALELEGVAQCKAIIQTMPDKKLLTLFWVAADSVQVTESALRKHLKSKLPTNMQPSVFEKVESFEFTRNGKLDVRKLKMVKAKEEDDTKSSFVEASNESEALLIKIASQILYLPQVNLADNFFNLGGDSLSAIQLKSELQKVGYDIDIEKIFEADSLVEIAAEIEVADFEKSGSTASSRQSYPLSSLQLGMLFHSNMDQSTACYHDISSYELDFYVNVEALKVTLNAIITKHEILRTVFDFSDLANPRQRVLTHFDTPLSVIDLQDLSEQEVAWSLDNWSDSEKREGFDWAVTPPWRVVIHQLPQDKTMVHLSFHHALLDGWSEAALVTEILQQYQQYMDMGVLNEEKLSIQYSSFIEKEQAALNNTEHRNFWASYLNDCDFSNELNSQVAKGEAKDIYLDLSSSLSNQLVTTAKRLNVPLKSLLLTAHMVALSGLFKTHDALSCYVSNGRNDGVDGDKVLGLFLTVLPFRLTIKEQGWDDLITSVWQLERQIYSHRFYPLAEIQKQTGLSHASNILFNYTDFHVLKQVESENSRITRSIAGDTGIPLSVDFFMANGDIKGCIGYLSTHVDDEKALELESLINLVLKEMVEATPAIQPEEVCRLPRHKGIGNSSILINEDYQSVADIVSEKKSVLTLFNAHLQNAPDNLAVIEGDRSLSYQEYESLSNLFANTLLAKGVKAGDTIAIYSKGSMDSLVAVLSVLKVGAKFVNLDPRHPIDRLSQIILDANVKLLLHDSLEQFSSNSQALVETFSIGDISKPTDSNLHELQCTTQIEPNSVACLIFTSGTTGKPKGVCLDHANLLSYAVSAQQDYAISNSDRVMQYSNLSFDIFLEELCLSIFAGGTLVIDNSKSLSCAQLLQVFEKHQVSVLTLPTGFWASMVLELEQDARLTMPASVTTCIVGGEAMNEKVAASWHKVTANRTDLINTYGPTETTCVTTSYRVTPEHKNELPIGRPLANSICVVVDEKGDVVPHGGVGELLIGGQGVCGNYLNLDPDSDTDTFVENRFNVFGGRLYRSGDLVKLNDEGQLQYLGRKDKQVKIRGYRVSPIEVNEKVNAHPHVLKSHVVINSVQVIAFYIANDNSKDENSLAQIIHDDLITTLPSYMLPSVYQRIDALPLTPNGKVDESQLLTLLQQNNAERALTTQTEQEIANIWAFLFAQDIASFNADSEFFMLGGDSLKAVVLIEQIRESFGISLSIIELYNATTIERLARTIDKAKQSKGQAFVKKVRTVTQSAPTLVAIHPVEGTAGGYMRLLEGIDAQANILAFERPELADSDTVTYKTIETLANTYCQGLQNYDGELILIGWSLGGTIAFEMASNLEAMGKKVTHLIMLDSYFASHRVIANKLPPLQEQETFSSEQWQGIYKEIAQIAKDSLNLSLISRSNTLSEVAVLNAIAQENYTPHGKLSCAVTRFVAGESDIKLDDTLSQYTDGGLEEITLSANHYSIMTQPAVTEISNYLNRICKSTKDV